MRKESLIARFFIVYTSHYMVGKAFSHPDEADLVELKNATSK